MTTVAYRAGVMAADTQGNHGEFVVYDSCKMFKHGARVFAFAGYAVHGATFERAVREMPPDFDLYDLPELPRDKDGETELDVLIGETDCFWLYAAKGLERKTSPYFAMGADATLAMGAMYAGADPVTAVHAAVHHGRNTGGEVHSMWCD